MCLFLSENDNTKTSTNGENREIIQNIYKHKQFYSGFHGKEKDNDEYFCAEEFFSLAFSFIQCVFLLSLSHFQLTTHFN